MLLLETSCLCFLCLCFLGGLDSDFTLCLEQLEWGEWSDVLLFLDLLTSTSDLRALLSAVSILHCN